MAEIDQELQAYEKLRPDLESNHMGEWVLIHDGSLIAMFDSFESAAKEAVSKFGRGPYLIKQIGAPPITLPASVAYFQHGSNKVRV